MQIVEDQQMAENPRQRDNSSPFSPLPSLVSWSYVPNDLNISLNFSSSLPSSPLQTSSDSTLQTFELHPSQIIQVLPPNSPIDFHLPVEDLTDDTMEEVGFATWLTHPSWSNVPISLLPNTPPEELELSSPPSPGPSSLPLSESAPLPASSSPAEYQVYLEGETPGITLYSIPKFKLIIACCSSQNLLGSRLPVQYLGIAQVFPRYLKVLHRLRTQAVT